MHGYPGWGFAVLLALGIQNALGAGDAGRGEVLYEARCGGCHAVDHHRVGPRHAGVVGRKAGSLTDFDYSPALRKSKLVWTAERLEQWLTDPERLIPGQRMGYRLANAGERADIVAYLRTLTAEP